MPLKTLKNIVPPTVNASDIAKKPIDDKMVRKFEPKKITEENKNLLKEALQSVLKTVAPKAANNEIKDEKADSNESNVQNNQPKEISKKH